MPTARHPKATTFILQKLLAGVKSFADLERRIAGLPDEQAKGDAFEVFAEAYLATQRKHDAAQIWPLPAMPLNLVRKLGLTSNDYGVDGVLQTTLGQLNVYQVKFRTDRQPLVWRELSTFMGLADSTHIHRRVLFTNCNELPAVMNERRGFFCIRGSDLDRLQASDFAEIENWLAGVMVPVPRKAPREHQSEALDALLPALRVHDRVTAIMACGTGKTLLALWLAEHVAQTSLPEASGGVPAARILVLLPSLALVRQTLHEWLHETRLPSLAYLCVCSDRTVASDLDTIATPQSELDFEVTTDSRTVREFLDTPFAGVKVIFSTYQSVQKAIKPALRKGDRFDLAIFDEAHKTAGREGRNFAFALDDKNLAIRKRLFLTATPRHYNPLRKDKEGDAQLVFSMDKPDVYGPQAYRLTFAEAARRGLICNYKVIISVITAARVTNELLNRGEVLVKGDAVRARQVANQIALTDAINKYGVNKVFTFHSSVKSAASFTSDGTEGIGTHLAVAADLRRLTSKRPQAKSRSLVSSAATDEFKTFHVNGTMPTALRERVMHGFRECASSIMSNARCLTEGVDVPAVDMVAFLSPRHSRVDIVQATGRAMRLAPGKTTGYVLVPLYLEQAAGETVEQAVSRADFDEVWDVLQSLQEQDEVLAEIIREMREERGRTKGFDDSRFRERVDVFGQNIALATLRQVITTACIEALTNRWEERFGEISEFKARFGHCDVPKKWPENPTLARWVGWQRRMKKVGQLRQDRVQRLESLGFVWELRDEFWEDMFTVLLEYKRKRGHCNVPHRCREARRLGAWVLAQRRLRKLGKMSEDRIFRLEEIAFAWTPQETSWEEMFSCLLEYRRKHGHCNVPRHWHENPKLASWIGVQRQLKSKNKLQKDRLRQMESVGLVWDPRDCAWEEMFSALVAYARQHGHCNVPRGWVGNLKLSRWMLPQRQAWKNGSLRKDRGKRLEEIGFIWDPSDAHWEEMFAALVAYKAANGTSNAPSNSRLASWATNQRKARRDGTLSEIHARRLNALGFNWNPRGTVWQEMFGALIQYKSKHGNCNVPFAWRENPRLGNWVAFQRQLRKAGQLSEERYRRLSKIGMNWDRFTSAWERALTDLIEYKRDYGDCDVSREWTENPQLANWVKKMRHVRKTGRLTKERIRRLNQIGFRWEFKKITKSKRPASRDKKVKP